MRPNVGKVLNGRRENAGEKSLFWMELRWAVVLALLVLLTMGHCSLAQCTNWLLANQESSATAESLTDYPFRNSSVGSSLGPQHSSMPPDGTRSPIEVPTKTSFSRTSGSGFLEAGVGTAQWEWPHSMLPPSPKSVDRQLSQSTSNHSSDDDSIQTSNAKLRSPKPFDPNQSIYYKNKIEFSLEGGWLPINIPFPFDFLLGDSYNFPGLYYTLVPVIASMRWHVDDIEGPWILRGNWDVTFSGSVTLIPRGAETRYFSYMMGIRRNFVRRRWKAVPYVDGSLGLGNIDAKGPLGVEYAQGQDFTFTLNLGSGIRYNFSPRYALEGGVHYMHISNLYLSQPKFLNYGINVYGPWAGINIRISKHRLGGAE